MIIQRRLAAVDQLSKKITEDDLRDTSPDFAQFLLEAQGLLSNKSSFASSNGKVGPQSGSTTPSGHLSQSSSVSNMRNNDNNNDDMHTMDGIVMP